MRKSISLLVLSSTGSRIKQISISKTMVRCGSLLAVVALTVCGALVYDYIHMKHDVLDNSILLGRISDQQDTIGNQRMQIHKFGNEINSLKKRLVALNDFEKQIRIIANIEKPENEDSLFGVGGSIPEDLDTSLELKQEHQRLLRAMHEQVDQLDFAATQKENEFEALLKYLEGQRNLLACTPAIRPSKGWATSGFGYRKSPFTGRREFHKGLDIANKIGTPIIATADGVVKYVGKKGLLGRVVVIDHGHGMVTRYAHLHKALKKRGDKVKRGDIIAQVGNSGRSTGPHLHYEVHLNGIPVNPRKYILN
jgi:murein DD-endopeptidase MepM/ murein hydrolase activator NlpD